MKKSISKLSVALALAFGFTSLHFSTVAEAKPPKKAATSKTASKAEVARQKKLLAKTTEYPTAYSVTYPDVNMRAAVVDFKPSDKKGEIELTLYPIEMLGNPHHYVTMDHFKNGLTLKVSMNAAKQKELKKGGVLELNQYSKETPTSEVGGAKLISTQTFTESNFYDVAPIAYIAKAGFEPEQVFNAIRAALLFEGKIEPKPELKTALENLSKSKDAQLSQEAQKLLKKVFN